VNITSGTSIFNSWGVRERNAFYSSSTWYYRNEYYTYPAQPFYDRNVSTIFVQDEEPTDYLTYDEESLGTSNVEMSVSLLSGWEYNKTDTWSTRTMSYVLQIVDGGANGTATFKFKRVPYLVETNYYTDSSYTSMYSEALYILKNSTQVHFLNGQPPKEHDALWAETRRKDPAVSNEFVTLMLADDRTLQYFEWIQPLEYEKVEYDLSIPCKQVTWFNGDIILLGLDMKLYRYLPASGMSEIYSTSFNTWDDVMLVTHPDQTYCYLIGGSSQVILDATFTPTVVSETWSGLEQGLGYTNFDVNGKIWVGNVRRSEADLSVEYTHPVPALCNYTYLGSSDGTCYALDGTEYSNVPTAFGTNLYTANLRWRYPQWVMVPYNANDFEAMSEQETWWGYDVIAEEFVEYDGTNAIAIPDTNVETGYASVEITDGVQINFDDDSGVRQMTADDFIYFTVAQGYIKDALSEVNIKLLLSQYNYTQESIDITVSGTTYDIPEQGESDFKHMNTTIVIGHWDNDTDVPASFTTSDTTPASGTVYISSTGDLIFNAADVGRVFYMDYFVAYEV
jgi:hypothetical protein